MYPGMLSMRLPRSAILIVVLLAALLLSGCGFHLRRSAVLLPTMQRMVVRVNRDSALRRGLALALRASGVHLADAPGPGIAVLNVPVARFQTRALAATGFARVGEYSVLYHVVFEVQGPQGKVLLPRESVDMRRSYTFDRTQVIGSPAEQ
ncbi:MAG TPA: hypothetical protein ENI75_00165, partial [Mizugakiibacter sp.]|nr:hypothetical protein [Mizugakiibacter sp.]